MNRNSCSTALGNLDFILRNKCSTGLKLEYKNKVIKNHYNGHIGAIVILVANNYLLHQAPKPLICGLALS